MQDLFGDSEQDGALMLPRRKADGAGDPDLLTSSMTSGGAAYADAANRRAAADEVPDPTSSSSSSIEFVPMLTLICQACMVSVRKPHRDCQLAFWSDNWHRTLARLKNLGDIQFFSGKKLEGASAHICALARIYARWRPPTFFFKKS